MLVKLRVEKSGDVDSVWISDAFLDQQIAAIRYWERRVERAGELPLD